MKRVVLFLVLVLMAVIACPPAEAIDDNAGTAGYSFLKIGVGARSAGMANAYVAVADDYSALYYNPAGITGARLMSEWHRGVAPASAAPATYLAAAYNSWISDFQSGFLALISPISRNQEMWFGASIQYLDYGDLIETNSQGQELGTFGASDMAFAATGAKRLNFGSDNGSLALGLTGRLILSSIHDESSWGLAADVGAMYYLADNRTQIGLAVTNLGAQMDGFTTSHKDKLPIKLAVGGSHKMRGMPLIMAADITKAIDDQIRFSLGSELVSFAPFYLRAGFSSRRGDIETGSSTDGWAGFTGGLGIAHNQFRLDYAIGQLSELGTVHRVGLTTRI